jgi:hypothetical protein
MPKILKHLWGIAKVKDLTFFKIRVRITFLNLVKTAKPSLWDLSLIGGISWGGC